jgi:DNA-binding transcriptional MerR regulator
MPVDQLTGYGTLEVALKLGISTEMVRYWAAQKVLPAVKLENGRLYFDRQLVDGIVRAREGEASE